ncbi:hypothetical protein Enr13x_57510 [Stieleria neptunia]|uniref:ACR n=1 Tax=Stieleria neptunia TaxID=2527979 RepID=A0A518HYB9_9BACT|nr:DUF192 domain-containing protein [Stieleria neptunia]QDV45848.1 hypothetical protein Enr13x_57510 [Stieleria neptunia]
MKLINADSGEVLLDQLEFADTYWKRFKGLQLRRSLPQGSGLLLSPCSSLHTCFMRFSIDVIMLDRENVVLGKKLRMRPWRVVICNRGTARVIEVSPGSVDVADGTQLSWMDS